MFLPITLTIAGASALLSLWLALRVSQLRFSRKVSIGDGGDQRIAIRMRSHANFSEYTPIFLILLAAVELAVGASLWLWGIAIVFILGRLSHPFGMERQAPNALRVVGMILTWTPLAVLAGWAIALTYIRSAEPPPRQLAPATKAELAAPPAT